MKLKNILLLLSILLATQGFAQSKATLAKKIETLSSKVLKSVHTEDVFLKTGKSTISEADHQEIKKIVMGNGFPTISMVGRENSHKFWMLVQLCDHDIQLQVAVLKQMGRADRKGDIIKEDFAMLTDRTRLNRDLPQLYGTQYVVNDFGDVQLYRVHDMRNVNERRKSLSLSKLAEAEAKVKTKLKKQNAKKPQLNDKPLDVY